MKHEQTWIVEKHMAVDGSYIYTVFSKRPYNRIHFFSQEHKIPCGGYFAAIHLKINRSCCAHISRQFHTVFSQLFIPWKTVLQQITILLSCFSKNRFYFR